MSSPLTATTATTISVLSNFSNSRAPEEYPADSATTAGDLVKAVLARHSMLSKDPHLLYVTLDTLGPRGFAESVELGDNARLLQRLRTARLTSNPALSHVFVMHMRSGGLLKIHDACIMPGSFYNSLYVSMETTTTQVIALLLASYGSREQPRNFQLVAKDAKGHEVRRLTSEEFPLAVQQQHQSHQSRASGGELSIHLRRANDLLRSPTFHGHPSGEQTSGGEGAIGGGGGGGEVLSRSETLARLQASFRELQRLREQNPDMYDKLLVAGQQLNGGQLAPAKKSSAGKQVSAKQPVPQTAKQHVYDGSSGFLSARQHSVRLGSSRQRPTGAAGFVSDIAADHAPGSLSARTAKSTHTERYRNTDSDYWFAGGEYEDFNQLDEAEAAVTENTVFLSRQLRANRSARGQLQKPRQQPMRQHEQHEQQQPQPSKQQRQQAQSTQQSSKRQLPQLPQQSGDSELRARRLKLEHAAQRQLLSSSTSGVGGVVNPTDRPRQQDFQCQATPLREESPVQQIQQRPSLREILAVCETHSFQLTRRSQVQPWGLRWREVQFGEVNGNCESLRDESGMAKPAIGKRQGAFRRNERLLNYMRTLIALAAIDNLEAVSTTGDLRVDDLIVEVNGCLATGLAPDQLDSLIDSQLTLDLLVARQPVGASVTTEGSTVEFPETESGLSDKADTGDLRLRLRRLQLQYNELATQCRVNEQVIQRLRSQLTKTARVCLLQHTEARPKSHAESERSFQVINASRDSPVTSAV